MSSFPCVPTFYPLHLLPTLPARLLPAACLAGPAPAPAPPTTGLPPACYRGMSRAHLPHTTCICPPLFFPESWAWLATPHSLSCSPSTPSMFVPLICLLVELKGQISTKFPAISLGREPRAKTGQLLRGLEGAQLHPSHQGTPRAGVCYSQKPGLGLSQTQQARAQVTIHRKKSYLKEVFITNRALFSCSSLFSVLSLLLESSPSPFTSCPQFASSSWLTGPARVPYEQCPAPLGPKKLSRVLSSDSLDSNQRGCLRRCCLLVV